MKINATPIGYAIDYLQKRNIRTPRIVLLSVVLAKFSQLLCHNRVRIKTSSMADGTFPNVYTLTFMRSGGGKDKPFRDFDEMIPWFKGVFNKRAEEFRTEMGRTLEQEADEKFGDKSPGAKAQYIRENTPHFLLEELRDGTSEGLTALRESFERAAFGCTFLKISEFGDFITSDNSLREALLSYIVEVYDFGDSAGKVIKGNVVTKSVQGVPSVCTFHTSISGLLEGKNHTKLMTFLNRGGARRFLTAYVDGSEESYIDKSLSVEEQADFTLEEQQEAEEILDGGLADYVRDVFDKTSNKYTAVSNNFVFDKTTERALSVYEARCANEAEGLQEEGIAVELSSRPFKAIKLAGVVAAFCHPEEKVVYKPDLEMAIEVLEFYSKSYKKFYLAEPETDFDKIAAFFAKNINKFYKKNEIIKKIGLQRNDFFRIWKYNYADLEEYAIGEGLEFVEIEDETSTSRKKPKLYGFREQSTEEPAQLILKVMKQHRKLTKNDLLKSCNIAQKDAPTFLKHVLQASKLAAEEGSSLSVGTDVENEIVYEYREE